MIERIELPFASYGENLPNGRFVASYASGLVQSSEGSFSAPVDLIYTRINPISGFVGVGHSGEFRDEALECINGIFQTRGQACGNSPVAYWPDGTLVVCACAPPYGSQGIRWIDTSIHPGDDTMSNPLEGIYQYTTFAGIKVGQGGDGIHGEDPCIIIFEGIRYLLESGTCRVIRFNYDAIEGKLAISFWKMNANSNVRIRMDISDILTLIKFPLNPDEPIVRINKPCWLGWYEFNQPPPILPPGNALVKIRYDISGATIKYDGIQFAEYIDGPTVENIESRAQSSPWPCIVYWDGRNWPRYPILKSNDWLGLQAYCQVGEPIALFEQNMRAQINAAQIHHPKIGLICQCYTSNSSLTSNIKGLVPVFARLARDYNSLNFLLVFSDQNRATGLNDHPELRPLWEQVMNGITGEPDDEFVSEPLDTRILDTLKSFRPNYPTPMGANSGKLLNDGALVHKDEGYGLERKDGGNVVFVPGIIDNSGNPIPLASDIIRTLSTGGWDVFEDAEGACKVKDSVMSGPVDPNKFIAPVGGGSLPDFRVELISYDTDVHRSDPKGMLIRFDVTCPNPVIEVELDLVGDGEPSIIISFKDEPRRDGRYCRALAFKPTVNGSWTLQVSAKDNQGNTAEVMGLVPVNVSP